MSIKTWPNTLIAYVIDGDTMDAHVTTDIGFEGTVTYPVRLRLARINAPKITTNRGKYAKQYLNSLFTQEVQVTTIRGYKYGAPKDKEGEWMAEVVLADGRNVSDLMVEEGVAVYWSGEGDRPADTISPR